MRDRVHHRQVVTNSTILAYREGEFKRLRTCVNAGISTLVSGPFGSGKTSVAKSVISELEDRGAYVDCTLSSTTNSVLRTLLIESGFPPSSRSTEDLLGRLKEVKRLSTICLDHVQLLKEFRTLDLLLRLGFRLVLITDGVSVYDRMGIEARSHVVNHIEFQRYSEAQMRQILSSRTGDTVPRLELGSSVVEDIARRCEGNVTHGLALLHASSVRRMTEDGSRIERADIQSQLIAAEEDDDQILLRILRTSGDSPPWALYERYSLLATSKSKRSFRRHLQRLVSRGLVKATGRKRGSMYAPLPGIGLAKP
jgi:Cdc6-like AAA superfamily ATPase